MTMRKQNTRSVDRMWRKREPLFITGGNAKWGNCWGEWCGDPSKSEAQDYHVVQHLFLGIDPKELKVGSCRDICVSVFIVTLFTAAERWKHPSHPLSDKCVNKRVHTKILLNRKKERKSDTCSNMDAS